MIFTERQMHEKYYEQESLFEVFIDLKKALLILNRHLSGISIWSFLGCPRHFVGIIQSVYYDMEISGGYTGGYIQKPSRHGMVLSKVIM